MILLADTEGHGHTERMREADLGLRSPHKPEDINFRMARSKSTVFILNIKKPEQTVYTVPQSDTAEHGL